MKKDKKAFKVSYTEELIIEWTGSSRYYAYLGKLNYKDIVSKSNYSYAKYLDSYECFLEQNGWID